MTIDEIFNKIAEHMKKGLMIHDQIASIYGFLNLYGYQKCHEYHFIEESYAYRRLIDFYSDTYHKLIMDNTIENPKLIPSNWFKYDKMEVDINTRKNAIKTTIKQWIDWEQEAKKLLEDSYKELYEIGEIYAAQVIANFLTDTAQELITAHYKYIKLESSGYDMPFILDEQNFLYEKYKDKMRCIFDDQINSTSSNHSSW